MGVAELGSSIHLLPCQEVLVDLVAQLLLPCLLSVPLLSRDWGEVVPKEWLVEGGVQQRRR